MTFQSFLNTHISVAEHLLASNGGNNTVRQPHTLYPALCSSSLISLLFVIFIRKGLFLYILFYTIPISYLLLYRIHFRCAPTTVTPKPFMFESQIYKVNSTLWFLVDR